MNFIASILVEGDNTLRLRALTWQLFNGSQLNGKACDECKQKLVADFPFLEARPIR